MNLPALTRNHRRDNMFNFGDKVSGPEQHLFLCNLKRVEKQKSLHTTTILVKNFESDIN